MNSVEKSAAETFENPLLQSFQQLQLIPHGRPQSDLPPVISHPVISPET